MEQKDQNETIRELFQQLKACDERNIPSFLSTLNRAPDRSADIAMHSLRWGPLVTIALVAAVVAAFNLYWISSKNQNESMATAPVVQPIVLPTPRVVLSPPVLTVNSRPQRSRVKSRAVSSAAVIVQWRSPTEFLLPTHQGVMALPRLDDSLIKIHPPMEGVAN